MRAKTPAAFWASVSAWRATSNRYRVLYGTVQDVRAASVGSRSDAHRPVSCFDSTLRGIPLCTSASSCERSHTSVIERAGRHQARPHVEHGQDIIMRVTRRDRNSMTSGAERSPATREGTRAEHDGGRPHREESTTGVDWSVGIPAIVALVDGRVLAEHANRIIVAIAWNRRHARFVSHASSC